MLKVVIAARRTYRAASWCDILIMRERWKLSQEFHEGLDSYSHKHKNELDLKLEHLKRGPFQAYLPGHRSHFHIALFHVVSGRRIMLAYITSIQSTWDFSKGYRLA